MSRNVNLREPVPTGTRQQCQPDFYLTWVTPRPIGWPGGYRGQLQREVAPSTLRPKDGARGRPLRSRPRGAWVMPPNPLGGITGPDCQPLNDGSCTRGVDGGHGRLR